MKGLTKEYIVLWKKIYTEKGLSMKNFYADMYDKIVYINNKYPEADELRR